MTEDKKEINRVRYKRYTEIRDAKGVTDATVSRETGVLQSTLSDWKRGAYTPGFASIVKIANFLGVAANEFEQEEGE